MIEFIKKHKKAFIIGGCVVVGGALTWWLVGPEIVTVLAGLVAPAAGAASALPADKNDSADRKKDEESYPSEPDLSQKRGTGRKEKIHQSGRAGQLQQSYQKSTGRMARFGEEDPDGERKWN